MKVLRELNHPNVVKIYQFYPKDPGYYYMVLEFMLGGELFDQIVKKVCTHWFALFVEGGKRAVSCPTGDRMVEMAWFCTPSLVWHCLEGEM